MSSSATSAVTCRGRGSPTRNRIWPTSAISPTSPSWRSTTPALRRDDLVVAEPFVGRGDEGANLGEVGGRLVEGLLGGDAALEKLADALDLALRQRLPGLLLGEIGADLAVVQAGENIALGHPAPLAGAVLDDALARHGRHLGPAHRLHHAGRIDDLGCRAAADRLELDLLAAAIAPPQATAGKGGEHG